MKRERLLLFFLVAVIISFVSFFFANSQLTPNPLGSSKCSSKLDFQVFHLATIGETNSGRVTSVDINKDGGVLDIIAGFQWFEAPSWTRHQYARKEKNTMINTGGAYPFDLDRDGDIDLVMERRRADGGRELIWFENTKDGMWIRHTLPSPSRHFDIKMLKYKVKKAQRLFSEVKFS